MDLQKKSFEYYQSQLDIRSLVSTHTNLALLLKLLFKKEEMLLFLH